MSFRPRGSGEPTKGMRAMADALLPASPLVLPRCKTLRSPSPGTTCWRWDWAELLLFAPLAPGFHKSLFLTLKEWCGLQMQSGQEEASIGIYGKVIYTWEKGRGLKSYLSTPISKSLSPYSSFDALQSSSELKVLQNTRDLCCLILTLTKMKNAFIIYLHFPFRKFANCK